MAVDDHILQCLLCCFEWKEQRLLTHRLKGSADYVCCIVIEYYLVEIRENDAVYTADHGY